MKAHEVRCPDTETLSYTTNKQGRLLATVEPATWPEVTLTLAASPDDENGRSNWVWVRLPNGDLMLATYPQGDTYELITQTMLKGRI